MTYKFEEVLAWQKAHLFVLAVYRYTRQFPEDERFGLTSQFRRAAVSIEANIAEGYKKLGKADKLRFYNVSQGSLEDCRNYLILARDLEYLTTEQYNDLYMKIEDASRMLMLYIGGINKNNGIHD